MPSVEMEMMPGLSAPVWFVVLFKTIGFVLHLIPMNLWLVGLPLSLLFLKIGRENAQYFSQRLLKQMPILMALGINFGIVPLLFIQTAYYKAFYTSTILMAFHWMMILLLVLLAYYLIYGCSGAVISQAKKRERRIILYGSFASLFLVMAGLIFTSAWTMMVQPEAWPKIWRQTSISGAVSGMGTYWNDPAVFVRFGTMVGLACVTTAFWGVFDAWVLHRLPKHKKGSSSKPNTEDPKEKAKKDASLDTAGSSKNAMKNKMGNKGLQRVSLSTAPSGGNKPLGKATNEGNAKTETDHSVEQNNQKNYQAARLQAYRLWIISLGMSLAWLGFLLGGGLLAYYYFEMIPKELMATPLPAFATPLPPLDISLKSLALVTLILFGLPAVLLTLGKYRILRGKFLVSLLILVQVALLFSFALTRQFLQNLQLSSYWNVAALDSPESVHWNPIVTFLALFVLGLIVIGWMVRQMIVAARHPYSEQEDV